MTKLIDLARFSEIEGMTKLIELNLNKITPPPPNFSDHWNIFFLTVDKNNFGNKIPNSSNLFMVRTNQLPP